MFWVFDWLQESGLDSDEKIQSAFRDRKVYRNFQETARELGSVPVDKAIEKPSLVAGAGIDLTGAGFCTEPACIRAQVGDLVRHAWHYFDKVSVNDLTPGIASTSYKKANIPLLVAWLQQLLFLRNIGAADLVQFVRRAGFCANCQTVHAGEYGMDHLVSAFDPILEELLEGSTVTYEPVGSGVYHEVTFTTPFLKSHRWVQKEAATRLKSADEEDLKRQYGASMLKQGLDFLFTDVANAQLAHAPLGATAEFHRQMLGRNRTANPTVEQVIFNLELPMLADAPLKELMAVRNHEGALFNVFQDNLRLAVEEVIKQHGAEGMDKITQRVRRDIIDPDLHQIRYALEKNSKSLQRTGGMIAVGASAVTVGSLAIGHDPIFAAGAATLIAAAGWVQNALTARDDVTKSKMYFLFKASGAALKHTSAHGNLLPSSHEDG